MQDEPRGLRGKVPGRRGQKQRGAKALRRRSWSALAPRRSFFLTRPRGPHLMAVLPRQQSAPTGDSHSGDSSSDEDPPARKVKVPDWQMTLEASSFQYLFALPQGDVLGPAVRVANALQPKDLPAPSPASSTTPAAAAKGIAVPKKRGRPKGKREDKDREANSKLAQVEYYDDDYEVSLRRRVHEGDRDAADASARLPSPSRPRPRTRRRPKL